MISPVRITSADEISERAAKARGAQELWQRYSLTERVRCIRKIWREIRRARERVIRVVHEETGAPLTDLASVDIANLQFQVNYFTRHVHRILKDRAVSRPWIFLNKRAYVRNIPHGLVGVVASRAFPLLGPLADAFAAMLAGNAVVVKPAEAATRTYVLLDDILRASAMLPESLFQVVSGDASTGLNVLNESDMLVYTGSPIIGHEIARLASEQFKPIVLELGGKSAMIVLKDAPLERAARAAVWGGFSQCGQSPVGVQRIYVESDIYQEFADAVVRLAGTVRQSLELSFEAELGRLLDPRHLEVFNEHLGDARAKGARVIGGETLDRERLMAAPAVILDAPAEAMVMKEDTPGPVIALSVVRSGEEAIRLVNRSRFGLSASIWSKTLSRAETWSAYLNAGLIGVNELIQHYSICSLPYGGYKESGTGRRNSDEGLRIFCQPQSVIIHEWPTELPDWGWFPYNQMKARIKSAISRLV